MRPIKAATAWSVVVIAIGTAYAPGSYASSPPNPDLEEAFLSGFPGSAAKASASNRPLFAKEMAVLTAQGISPGVPGRPSTFRAKSHGRTWCPSCKPRWAALTPKRGLTTRPRNCTSGSPRRKAGGRLSGSPREQDLRLTSPSRRFARRRLSSSPPKISGAASSRSCSGTIAS